MGLDWAKWIEGYYGRYCITKCGKVASYKSLRNPQWLTPQVDKRSGRGYLRVGLYRNRKKKYPFAHRLVLEAFIGPCPEGLEACHEDGNPANNNLSNLRYDTHQANSFDRVQHRILRGEGSSKYVGVSWDKQHQKWRARIHYQNKKISLGYYTTQEAAARAFDKAVIKYHQPFADKYNLTVPTNKNRGLLP